MNLGNIIKGGYKLFDGSFDDAARATTRNSDIAVKSLDTTKALMKARVKFARDLIKESGGDVDEVLKAIDGSGLPLDTTGPMKRFFENPENRQVINRYAQKVKARANRAQLNAADVTEDVTAAVEKAPELKPTASPSGAVNEAENLKNLDGNAPNGPSGPSGGGNNFNDGPGGSSFDNGAGSGRSGSGGGDIPPPSGRNPGGAPSGGSGGSGARLADPFTPTVKPKQSWGGFAMQKVYDYGWQFPVRASSKFLSEYHGAMFSAKWAVEAQHAMRNNSIVKHLGDIDPSYLVHGHNYFPADSIGALPGIKKLRENIGNLLSDTGNSSIRGAKDQVTQTHQDIQDIITKLEALKGNTDAEAVASVLAKAEDQIVNNQTDLRLFGESVAKTIDEAQSTSDDLSSQADKLRQNIDLIMGRERAITAEGNMAGGKAIEKHYARKTHKAVYKFGKFGERSTQRLSNLETSFDDFVSTTNDKLERIKADFSGRTPEENIANLKNLLAALETQSDNLDNITKNLEQGFNDDALRVASDLRKAADEARDGATYETSAKNLFQVPFFPKLQIHQLQFERGVGLIARDTTLWDVAAGRAKMSDYFNDYNLPGKIFQNRNNFRRNIERAPGWAAQRSKNADGSIDKQAYDRHLRNQVLTALEKLLKVSPDGTGGRTVADEAGALDSLQWLSYTYGKEGAREGGISEDLVNFLRTAKQEAEAAGQDSHFLTDEFLNKVAHIQSRQVMVGANNVRENLSKMSDVVSGTRWYGDTLSELAHPGRTEFGAWAYIINTPFRSITWPMYYPYHKVGQFTEWMEKIPVVGGLANWSPRIPIIGLRLPSARTMTTATVGTAVNPVAWAYFLEEAVWEADGKIILDEDGNPVLGEDGKPLRESYGQDTQLDLAVNYGEFVFNTLDNVYFAPIRFGGELLTNDKRSVYSTFRWMMDRDDEWVRGTNNWNILRIDDNATLPVTRLTKGIDYLRDTDAETSEETPEDKKDPEASGTDVGGDELVLSDATLNRHGLNNNAGRSTDGGNAAGKSATKTTGKTTENPATDKNSGVGVGGGTGAAKGTPKKTPTGNGNPNTSYLPGEGVVPSIRNAWNTSTGVIRSGIDSGFDGNTRTMLRSFFDASTSLTEGVFGVGERFVNSASTNKNNRTLLALGGGLAGAALLPYLIGLTPFGKWPIVGSLLKFGAVFVGFALAMGMTKDSIPYKGPVSHGGQVSSNGHGPSVRDTAGITNFDPATAQVSNQNHNGQENIVTDRQFAGQSPASSFVSAKHLMPDAGNGFRLSVVDETLVDKHIHNGLDYENIEFGGSFDRKMAASVPTDEMALSA